MSPGVTGGGDRLRLLAEVAATLSAAESLERIMRGLTHRLVPALGDGCEVVLPDAEGVLRRIVLGSADAPWEWRAREAEPVPDLADHPVRVAWRTGEPQVLSLDDPAQVHLFGPADAATSARALGVHRAVVAPMLGRGRIVGVLGIGFGAHRAIDADDVDLVGVIARLAGLAIENVEALDQQRRAIQRLQRVGSVVAALSSADDVAGIANVLADDVGTELAADGGVVYLREVDDLVLAGTSGYSRTLVEGWETIAMTADVPAAAACRERRAVTSRIEPDRWLLSVPLRSGEEVIGSAGWSFREEPLLGADDVSFLEIAAEHAAAALARTTARDELERSRAQLWALAESGVIGIIVGEGSLIVEANDAFLSMLGFTREHAARGIDWTALTPPEWRARDESVVAQMLDAGVADAFEKEYFHADGHRVPVMIGGVTLSKDPFRWIVFVADLTERVQAEQRAEEARARLEVLLDEQRSIATTLQQSLLPAQLPSIPGFELHARYWAAGEGMEVGGDLYDVFPTGEGRWAVLVGDVTGKGVQAAAVIATARHTARAAALHFDDPTAVLRWVHDAVRLQAGELGRFCTMAYGTLVPGERPQLSIALAAHPQPIVVRADGRAEHVGRHGALLGVLDDPPFHTVDVELAEGDLVAMFTDGITDAPAPEVVTEEELAELLVAHRGATLEEVAEHVRQALDDRRPSGWHDDVALLLLRVTTSRN